MYYNVLKILKEGLNNNKGWKKTWKNPELKKKYDVIIIGGGGHGLATAFYLAKEFKIKNIAVLEKKWIGGGNVGRNTTIIRSNYLLNENEAFYEFSLKLWETLEKQINYIIKFTFLIGLSRLKANRIIIGKIRSLFQPCFSISYIKIRRAYGVQKITSSIIYVFLKVFGG